MPRKRSGRYTAVAEFARLDKIPRHSNAETQRGIAATKWHEMRAPTHVHWRTRSGRVPFLLHRCIGKLLLDFVDIEDTPGLNDSERSYYSLLLLCCSLRPCGSAIQ